MAKYRKKPVVIEAVQWPVHRATASAPTMLTWICSIGHRPRKRNSHPSEEGEALCGNPPQVGTSAR